LIQFAHDAIDAAHGGIFALACARERQGRPKRD